MFGVDIRGASRGFSATDEHYRYSTFLLFYIHSSEDFASFYFCRYQSCGFDLPLLLGDVKFTDRAECTAARQIIPFVRIATRKMYACLGLFRIIRLSCGPVSIDHSRHCCVRRYPDVCGLMTRVYHLPSRPESISPISGLNTSAQS